MLRLFQFLSTFNWVTPTIGLIQDFINDPTPLQSNSWTFFFSYDEALSYGWNAVDINRMLRSSGVHLWGSQMTGNTYFFSVRLEQAQWAEYLLAINQIPIKAVSMGAPKPKRGFSQGVTYYQPQGGEIIVQQSAPQGVEYLPAPKKKFNPLSLFVEV